VTIGLAVALVGLTALALAMLLVPLFLRRHGPAARDAYNLAVYRDQLAEIERDLARGVLAAEEGEAARAEIARRILALKPAEPETGGGSTPRVVAIVAILMCTGGSAPLPCRTSPLPDVARAHRRLRQTSPISTWPKPSRGSARIRRSTPRI
jgi:cytochrome c-type biogenesis protein CcmH